MLTAFATNEDVRNMVSMLRRDLAKHAATISEAHKRPDGREVWTKAIWTAFDQLRKQMGKDWTLYPESWSKGSGKAAGEFLTDYQLFDSQRGPRIACESELDFGRVDWAFDKLRCVKSDIKILIFEYPFQDSPASAVILLVRRYLTHFAHLQKGEAYVLIQLDHDQSKAFLWTAQDVGPIQNSEDIRFEEI